MIKYLTKVEKGKSLMNCSILHSSDNIDLELPTYIPSKFLDTTIETEDLEKLLNRYY